MNSSISLVKNRLLYSRICKLIKEYSEAVNGVTSFAVETIAGIPSTAHILGGAVMGANASEGVIDKTIKFWL
jgi:cholesterol oxidase